MTDRELLERVANQVEKLTQDLGGIKQDVGGLKQDMGELKEKVNKIDNTVIRIENVHGEKLSALFDGYKQNAERLDRIESEVTRHDEFLLKRIK
jgi:archaellum component FlaC